jgi:hypothetical protein
MFVRKIDIEAAVMLSNADIDRTLGSIKLRAGFEEIERCPDLGRARSSPGRLVIASAHPVSETFAADAPSFAVPMRYEVGERHSAGGVKKLLTEHHLVEH